VGTASRASYGLRKVGSSGEGDGCIDGQCGGDFNRCLLRNNYEKSSLNTNPLL
jgi:hypothetical protein